MKAFVDRPISILNYKHLSNSTHSTNLHIKIKFKILNEFVLQ
jgi:hypothetical protein